MQTVYDWATMIVFAGLIVLFLQRSQGEPRDHLWQYLVAAVGCATTNYLGNEGLKLESRKGLESDCRSHTEVCVKPRYSPRTMGRVSPSTPWSSKTR